MTDIEASLQSKTVFVLGAGFTKAFAREAPLMIDDYGAPELANKFVGFKHASKILDRMRNKYDDKIDIEQMMTRLSGLMPYDFIGDAADEYRMLVIEIQKNFINRIMKAKSRHYEKTLLNHFARYCVKERTACVTLNYDDIFDEALFQTWAEETPSKNCWNPSGGYGFFCRPSYLCIEDIPAFMEQDTAMLLLKLHGSINWFPRIGYQEPYSIDAMVHHEEWFGEEALSMVNEDIKMNREVVKRHIESSPFIIPPILTKSALIEQPILRVIWQLAYRELSAASEVVFIGYSMPITDISVCTLLTESLGTEFIAENKIKVVNYAQDKKVIQEIKKRYRVTLGDIPDQNFYFDGALKWIRNLITKTADEKGLKLNLF